MPFLVKLLLPLYDNLGHRFDSSSLVRVRRELTERFGGITAYTRAPAEGTWEDPHGATHRDDVVIIEVMADALDRAWWKDYAAALATRFDQQEMVVRAMAYESLSDTEDGTDERR